MYSFILLAGGTGKRMNNEVPKQFLTIAGKPIIIHTMERIDTISEISEVVVVCLPEYESKIEQLRREFCLSKPYIFASAGKSRQESVLNGLLATKENNVLIHEAARPFVKRNEFLNLISSPQDNVIMVAPINYTVLTGKEEVTGVLKRSELKNVQLPHKFSKDLLLKAHQRAKQDGKKYTEDASLLFEISGV